MFHDVYTINVVPNLGITRVDLSQYDTGKKLVFMLFGKEKLVVPGGTAATLTGVKPDGNVYSRTGIVDASSNTITFEVDLQMTAVPGRWEAKITCVSAGNTISTSRILFVVDSEAANSADASDSVIEGFTNLAKVYAENARRFAEQAKNESYGSPLTAMNEIAMVDTSRVYIYTGEETEDYLTGHWYYYDGEAWRDGGAYNAIDETLKISGKAADARTVGEVLARERDERIVADANLQNQIDNIDLGHYLVINGNWD